MTIFFQLNKIHTNTQKCVYIFTPIKFLPIVIYRVDIKLTLQLLLFIGQI